MGASKTRTTICYLSAFDGDQSRIGSQRERVASLLAPGFDDADVVVDVGWPDGEAVCPPGLFIVLRASRVRAVQVVAVETVARFARDRSTAGRIAAILSDAGVEIREANRDGLRMSPSSHSKRRPAPTRRIRRGAGGGERSDLAYETD